MLLLLLLLLEASGVAKEEERLELDSRHTRGLVGNCENLRLNISDT